MKEKLWTRNFVVIIVINFLIFANHFMLLACFPFFVEFMGGTEATAGALAALFSIVAVVFRPIFGWLLDRGKRKRILLFGIIILCISTVSYMVAGALLVVFAFRMLNGIGLSSASTSSSTITSDIIPKKRFSEGMGMFGLAITLATALAPSVGIVLMHKSGFSSLFLVAEAFVIAAIALFLFLNTNETPHPKKPLNIRTMFESNAIPASAVILLFMMTFGAIENFIAKFAVSSNLPGGMYFIFMSVAILLTRFLLGKVADRRGEAPFVYLGNIAMLAALVILAFNVSTFTFIVSALLAGFGFGGIEPALQAMAIGNVSPKRRGAANSTFLCAYDIGIGFGGGIAGFLITNLGYSSMFMVIALANLVSILIYLFWARNHSSAFR
ncbi:MAG: MFS transporter [Bacteroidales bacterium]